MLRQRCGVARVLMRASPSSACVCASSVVLRSGRLNAREAWSLRRCGCIQPWKAHDLLARGAELCIPIVASSMVLRLCGGMRCHDEPIDDSMRWAAWTGVRIRCAACRRDVLDEPRRCRADADVNELRASTLNAYTDLQCASGGGAEACLGVDMFAYGAHAHWMDASRSDVGVGACCGCGWRRSRPASLLRARPASEERRARSGDMRNRMGAELRASDGDDACIFTLRAAARSSDVGVSRSRRRPNSAALLPCPASPAAFVLMWMWPIRDRLASDCGRNKMDTERSKKAGKSAPKYTSLRIGSPLVELPVATNTLDSSMIPIHPHSAAKICLRKCDSLLSAASASML
ncbi:hypothetical protein B0H17DRAFT_1151971 [Mycena rosella]|uniref:Uncharacterized protein n=1 Tax=Mycena rosella TaxID=1033263 RepID=A0AAD7BGX2_MYCRO|nr:hypothetical protein B0H17DRAFT_1151971 [Mycena rosella]